MPKGDEQDQEETQEPKTLSEALLEFQSRALKITKDATADIPTKTGPGYKYSYATLGKILEVVLPVLTELKLLWTTQPGRTVEGQPCLHYELEHVPSETRIRDEMLLMLKNGGPQDQGIAISYARRYALLAVLGLAPDKDEDGAVGQPQGGTKKITKKMAEQLVAEATKQGLLPRLQLAASHVYGADVGDCSTKAKAITAMQKLSEGNAERLFNKIAEIGAANTGEEADADAPAE